MSLLPITKSKFRHQLQVGLCLIRLFYGFCALFHIISGLFMPKSLFYEPINHSNFALWLIGSCMAFGGMVLIVDGLAGLAVVLFPKIRVLNTICSMAQKVRTWCFIPVSFSYLMITFSIWKVVWDGSPESFEIALISSTLTAIYALFGLLFSLHENVIVNERNSNKEDVCRKD